MMGFIREFGGSIVSADDIAREILADDLIRREISQIAGLAGPYDPADLRVKMILDPDVRRKVNAFLHPFIWQRLRNSPANFFEIPLLFETCLQSAYDRVWVVSCGREQQWKRLHQRYGENEFTQGILDMQLRTEVKVAFADQIIRTNSSLEAVRLVVKTMVDALSA